LKKKGQEIRIKINEEQFKEVNDDLNRIS